MSRFVAGNFFLGNIKRGASVMRNLLDLVFHHFQGLPFEEVPFVFSKVEDHDATFRSDICAIWSTEVLRERWTRGIPGKCTVCIRLLHRGVQTHASLRPSVLVQMLWSL